MRRLGQAGGIAGAALVEGLTPRSTSDVGSTITTLSPGMTLVRGLFLEAFLTAMLVFVILMLAAEKHKVSVRPVTPVECPKCLTQMSFP